MTKDIQHEIERLRKMKSDILLVKRSEIQSRMLENDHDDNDELLLKEANAIIKRRLIKIEEQALMLGRKIVKI
jgi:hypothetical protein